MLAANAAGGDAAKSPETVSTLGVAMLAAILCRKCRADSNMMSSNHIPVASCPGCVIL